MRKTNALFNIIIDDFPFTTFTENEKEKLEEVITNADKSCWAYVLTWLQPHPRVILTISHQGDDVWESEEFSRTRDELINILSVVSSKIGKNVKLRSAQTSPYGFS